MNSSDRELLWNRRFLLGNPYAHVEQLYAQEDLSDVDLRGRLSADRKRLQDQYAHLEQIEELQGQGEGGVGNQRHRAVTFEEIERAVIMLQRHMWLSRSLLWPGREFEEPVEVLDVAMAAKVVGFDFRVVGSIGFDPTRSGKVRVAGLIDRQSKRIIVSSESEAAVQRFTGAHELGHAMLHPHLSVVHRDRSTDGSKLSRDRIELEADKFATYFLLPSKRVAEAFEFRFLSRQFELSEGTSFALLRSPLIEAHKLLHSRREISRFLATAVTFNGKGFLPLFQVFGVSPETMAIRLEELGLVPA